MSPLMALCVNSLHRGIADAIGGKAGIPRNPLAALTDAIGPNRTFAALAIGCQVAKSFTDAWRPYTSIHGTVWRGLPARRPAWESQQMNRAPRGKMIAAGTISNMLEWYDFAIYGTFAASIGRQFFPREDAVAQLLAAFGVFAVGYPVRPIGGAVVGYIGDSYGRSTALTVSVTAMAVPTFLMGLLPGY